MKAKITAWYRLRPYQEGMKTCVEHLQLALHQGLKAWRSATCCQERLVTCMTAQKALSTLMTLKPSTSVAWKQDEQQPIRKELWLAYIQA